MARYKSNPSTKTLLIVGGVVAVGVIAYVYFNVAPLVPIAQAAVKNLKATNDWLQDPNVPKTCRDKYSAMLDATGKGMNRDACNDPASATCAEATDLMSRVIPAMSKDYESTCGAYHPPQPQLPM